MYKRFFTLLTLLLLSAGLTDQWTGPLAAQDEQVLNGHTEPVNALAFSPDGSLLASGGDDISLRLWRVEDGEHIIALYPHNNVVKGVTFMPDGLLMSTSWDRSVALTELDMEADEPANHIDVWRDYNAVIEPIAHAPGGEWVAFGVGNGTIPLVDMETRTVTTTLTMKSLQVMALAFSADGAYLAAVGGFPEDRIYLWDMMDTEAEPITFTGHDSAITGLAFSAISTNSDGESSSMLASVGADGRLALWELSAAGMMQVGGVSPAEDHWLTAVAFHPQELVVAIGTLTGEVLLWDVAQADAPEQLVTYSGHDGPVNALAFSPDGLLLASGGADAVIRLWPVALGE